MNLNLNLNLVVVTVHNCFYELRWFGNSDARKTHAFSLVGVGKTTERHLERSILTYFLRIFHIHTYMYAGFEYYALDLFEKSHQYMSISKVSPLPLTSYLLLTAIQSQSIPFINFAIFKYVYSRTSHP